MPRHKPTIPPAPLASAFDVDGDLPIKAAEADPTPPAPLTGALTEVQIKELRARAEAEVAADMAATQTALYAQMKDEARARAEKALKAQVSAVTEAEKAAERDHRGFEREYTYVTLQRGMNPGDQEFVPLGVQGHFIRVQRGRKVPVPNVYLEVLRNAIATAMVYHEERNEIEYTDTPRFGFMEHGPASRDEYEAFKLKHPDSA